MLRTDGGDRSRRTPGFAGAGDVDDPMLTDSERVARLIATEGGRMRQSALVAHTGWSKARVSRLLAVMAERGTVLKVPVGRENVICLPGHEPPIVRDDG